MEKEKWGRKTSYLILFLLTQPVGKLVILSILHPVRVKLKEYDSYDQGQAVGKWTWGLK